MREGILDVHALGLANWVVFGVMGSLLGVSILEVPLHDESGVILDADLARGVGFFRLRWKWRWAEYWSGTDAEVAVVVRHDEVGKLEMSEEAAWDAECADLLLDDWGSDSQTDVQLHLQLEGA